MSKLFVCLSVLAVISLVAAEYDFKDSDFNELIFDDLTLNVEDKPLRFRRDSDRGQKKRKQGKDAHCCAGESGDYEAQEEAKEVKKKCIEEIRGENGSDDDELGYDPLSCEGVQAMREKTICAAECIVKKLNLLDTNGEFNRDALLNHTRKLAGDSKWKSEVVEEYVDECLNSLKASTSSASTAAPVEGSSTVSTSTSTASTTVSPTSSTSASSLEVEKKSDEKSSSCNPAPLELHHCMWKKFVEGCPAELQNKGQKCRKVRERLARGDVSHADKTFKKLFKHRH